MFVVRSTDPQHPDQTKPKQRMYLILVSSEIINKLFYAFLVSDCY